MGDKEPSQTPKDIQLNSKVKARHCLIATSPVEQQ